MTPKERVTAVYQGRTPDQVPLMLDLSHWYKKNCNVPFDLSGFKGVEQGLVDLHKKLNAVSYVEMGAFFSLYFEDESVKDESWTDARGVYHRRITTPAGILEEERVFSLESYSYNIKKHLVESVDDFDAVRYVMDRYRCRPRWDLYEQWQNALGELGYLYAQIPYSGLGYLIARNFGVEKTCMAMFDCPDRVHDVINSINDCNLRILDTLIDGPFDTLFISDNFDSNVQNPKMFDEYSRAYYSEVARRLHQKDKYLAVHVDGEMKGCLANFAACSVDCIDAATPAPMFRLTPLEARKEAGSDMILSGGIPATVFGADADDEVFERCVRDWLEIRTLSPRLIMAAGDQVPTDAPWHKIERLPRLVEKYGKYQSKG